MAQTMNTTRYSWSVERLLGPWSITGPSRVVAQAALLDRTWQAATRSRLQQDGERLRLVLQEAGISATGGCYLFRYIQIDKADFLHRQLAQRGILTRLFGQPPGIRFGLPGGEAEWLRLHIALAEVCK